MSLLPSTFLISLLLFAAPQDQDQAERLFDNAKTFMNAGKYQEALTDLENLVTAYGQTPWAPKALLEIGNYYQDVESDFDRALGYYEQVRNRHPQSEEAPAAYYFKARIIEQRGQTRGDLEDAVADLIRMNSLYPESPWHSGALFLWGKLAYRLGNFSQCLSYFQRLEFGYPGAAMLPEAQLLSAQAAYLEDRSEEAARILARLQRKFPNTEPARTAAAYLRILDYFARGDRELTLEQSFFGATPKRFHNPETVTVTPGGQVCIRDNKGVHFGSTGPFSEITTVSARDLTDVTLDRDGQVVLVYDNRLIYNDGTFINLNPAGGPLREILAAAFDNFGRIYVVDDDLKATAIFAPDGTPLRNVAAGRPQKVRCFRDRAYILNNDGRLTALDTELNSAAHPFSSLGSVSDFCFDPLGNLYTIADRGYQLAIYNYRGELKVSVNLKSGAFPMKQAQAIGVDAGGAVYLSDRRGGAVFRFL